MINKIDWWCTNVPTTLHFNALQKAIYLNWQTKWICILIIPQGKSSIQCHVAFILEYLLLSFQYASSRFLALCSWPAQSKAKPKPELNGVPLRPSHSSTKKNLQCGIQSFCFLELNYKQENGCQWSYLSYWGMWQNCHFAMSYLYQVEDWRLLLLFSRLFQEKLGKHISFSLLALFYQQKLSIGSTQIGS